jgi:hypothetical protein
MMTRGPKDAWKVFLILIVALIVIGKQCGRSDQSAASRELNSQPKATESAAVSEQDLRDGALVMCRIGVKHRLKAPDSADFQSYNDDVVAPEGHGKFVIQTKADALNSFGAKLRATFLCEVKCVDKWNCTIIHIVEK